MLFDFWPVFRVRYRCMPELVLEALKRSVSGKKLAAERKKGFLPAILYGRGIENMPLFLDFRAFEQIFEQAGENTLIKLELKDEGKVLDTRNVLIYDVARDYLTGKPIHVDLYQVRMDKEVRVAVPLNFSGVSPAVVRDGGILVKAMQEIEVEALPQYLPHEITVDLSRLEALNSTLYVRDIAIPPHVKVLVDPDTPIVSVEPPRSEEELEALKEAVVEKVEEVKVVGEEKREKEAAEKAAAETGEAKEAKEKE